MPGPGVSAELLARLVNGGQRAFGEDWRPDSWASAPGRLELLGNHIDYNGGPVLAGAIDRSVVAAIGSGAEEGSIELYALDVDAAPFTLQTDSLGDWHAKGSIHGPKAYASGVVASLIEREVAIRSGTRVAIAGDVPIGFGMSSSAGLCVALTIAFTDADAVLAARDIVVIARAAEHRAGSPVGAMDQSASVAGGIILFDGATTSFERLDPDLGTLAFAVAGSGVSHALTHSSYPRRVEESAEALGWLRGHGADDLKHLADLDPDRWAAIRRDEEAIDSTLRQRIDHVVSEVARVREGVSAVRGGDWTAFGRLMTASGRSSATDYEISHPIVEELVTEVSAMPGVLGARMMGGGEGGPALVLLEQAKAQEVQERLNRGFFTHHPSSIPGDRFQVCVFGPGARRWPGNQ